MSIKTLAIIVVFIFLAQYGWKDLQFGDRLGLSSPSLDLAISQAFEHQQSDVQVQGEGIVQNVLADDTDGSRHQRFILRLGSGQTVLVAHNIDLAPRVASLQTGDAVEFFGEFEWNPKGGVIHWTHHDPRGTHVEGWLKHKGRIYK